MTSLLNAGDVPACKMYCRERANLKNCRISAICEKM